MTWIKMTKFLLKKTEFKLEEEKIIKEVLFRNILYIGYVWDRNARGSHAVCLCNLPSSLVRNIIVDQLFPLF